MIYVPTFQYATGESDLCSGFLFGRYRLYCASGSWNWSPIVLSAVLEWLTGSQAPSCLAGGVKLQLVEDAFIYYF